LSAIVALTLPVAPTHAQIWLAAEVGISKNQLGTLVDIPDFHFSWKTRIHLALDGAVGISWGNGGVYDSADGDLSYDAIRVHGNTTLGPRVGLSTMFFNDKSAQNGFNAGIALRAPAPRRLRRTPDTLLRIDFVYRRLAGHTWNTIAAGVEFH